MDKQDERKKPHGKTDPKRGDIMKRIIKDLTGGGNDGGGGGASDGVVVTTTTTAAPAPPPLAPTDAHGACVPSYDGRGER